eukprot:scaffold48869_cov52-Phaeocystis_antarctica.AAC.1
MPPTRSGARIAQACPILHGSAPGSDRYFRGQGTPRLLGSGLYRQASYPGRFYAAPSLSNWLKSSSSCILSLR